MNIRLLAVVSATMFAMGAGAAQAARPGGYVGLGLGQTKAVDLQNDACSQLNGFLAPGFSCSVDSSSSSGKLFFGYQFNRYIAAEAAFIDFGRFDGSATGNLHGSPTQLSFRYEADGFSFDAVGTAPITKDFGLLARAGVFSWGVTDIFDDRHSGGSVDYGVGLSYEFTPNLGLRAEYVRYLDVGNSETGKTDLDVSSVSLLFRF